VNEAELLLGYRPWLRAVASRLTGPDKAEDLAQEGWIAMWRAVGKHDPELAPLDYWLKNAAQSRMFSVLRNYAAKKNTSVIAAGHPVSNSTDSVTERDELWDALSVDLPAVELAYHHGEIAAALTALSPKEREYVELRFWHGFQKRELIAHFGYEPRGLHRTATKKLAVALKHLAPV